MNITKQMRTFLRSNLGFSLPEVAIAVAIAATGLVTLLGVIPSGLSSVRNAGEMVSSARIATQVAGEIQLSDWGRLISPTTGSWSELGLLLEKKWYFDDQANPISDHSLSSAQGALRLAYVVRVRPSPSAVVLPGIQLQNPYMKAVVIDVALTANPNFDFSNPLTFKSFPAILTRQYSRS